MACIDLLSPSATLSPRHFYETAAFLTNLKLDLSMESTHTFYNRSTGDHGFMSNLVIENRNFSVLPCNFEALEG